MPTEEIRKLAVCHAVEAAESLIQYQRFSNYDKLHRVMAYVVLFIDKIKVKQGKASKPTTEATLLQERHFKLAEQIMVQNAQRNLDEKQYVSLRPKFLVETDIWGILRSSVVIAGRLDSRLSVGYDKEFLPLLEYKSPLARLIMLKAHNVAHPGIDKTVQRARTMAWIIRGGRLAKTIRFNCFKCRIIAKKKSEQIMAPLVASRLPPSPVFDSTAIDLFGPLQIKDAVKGRNTGKCWGVIFCCTVTSAIHIEVTEDYSCDSFLLCLRRFVNLRGTPSRFQSDPGDQLVAAAKQVGTWDFDRIAEWTTGRKSTWHFIPTNSQHFNGVAEAMIKVTKRQLGLLLQEKKLTKGELDTILSDVVRIVNSRPLMVKAGSDPWSGGPITPLHLLGGRATIEVPLATFDYKASLTKRLRFIEELKEEFWSKWFAQVFEKLVPCQKWRTTHRDVQVGDIVLFRMSMAAITPDYKMARIKEVYPGEDGHVRRVLLEYKAQRAGATEEDRVFKTTERAIHNIVVIVPADWTPQEDEIGVLEDE